ncbi:type II toxin-antitoxin system HipA family toxin [Porticoccus sp. W117]|uniref:type II toxin-antitoxin system HipA family toxin n=1 Tax=Porticoccus sp. W117 TaxID=3054777 RepID=UPI00259A5CEB|nr:type II toxin-antitoxin system HipA family toxin [Porticoccus sp. W117]MDM3870012.1 type II toxin-antitoxin system HipA family toxin [Porticoccus sp. W117]
MTTATVKLWGTPIGYVSMDQGESFARFEYDPVFASHGIELAPLTMPARAGHIYQFTDLHPRSFHGLPGLLADSLPDKYGNKLIDVWLAQTGRSSQQFNAVDRLCYTGTRGMGALEFEPATDLEQNADKALEVQQLVELASMAFANRQTLDTHLSEGSDQGLLDILSVGTSAGGARAKAVIAFNPKTNQVRSGQLQLPADFEHWLIKFDGVEFNGDWGVADPAGYGLLEYSYYQIARSCGIDMMESRLFQENGRNHFMTRRFDRSDNGQKLFMQTLGALAHFDYWESGYYSYEQLFMVMKQLHIPQASIEQQFRRTVFNLVGCNQDDHVKNFSFTMNRNGQWDIAPAYDLCHSEGSNFTRNHQLSINGKTNNFDMADLKHLANYAGLPRGREKRILDEVLDGFSRWPELANELNIPLPLQNHVMGTWRIKW